MRLGELDFTEWLSSVGPKITGQREQIAAFLQAVCVCVFFPTLLFYEEIRVHCSTGCCNLCRFSDCEKLWLRSLRYCTGLSARTWGKVCRYHLQENGWGNLQNFWMTQGCISRTWQALWRKKQTIHRRRKLLGHLVVYGTGPPQVKINLCDDRFGSIPSFML